MCSFINIVIVFLRQRFSQKRRTELWFLPLNVHIHVNIFSLYSLLNEHSISVLSTIDYWSFTHSKSHSPFLAQKHTVNLLRAIIRRTKFALRSSTRALLSRIVSSRPVSFYNTQMMDDRTVLRLLHFCFMLFYVLFAGVRYTVAVFVCCCLLAHDTMKRETKKICSFFSVVLVEIVGYSKFCILLRIRFAM